MKKWITFIIFTFMLTIPFSAAYAGDTGKAKPKSEAKAMLIAKKDALKAQRQANDVLRAQIKTKQALIKTTIKELRKVNDAAAKAKIESIKSQLTALTASRDTLKGLKDAGKPYWAQFKTNVKGKNLDAAMTNLNSIAGIKNSRYEALVKINTVLDTIISSLK